MRVTNGVLRWQYVQQHQPGRYLGRNLELDARSLNFLARVVDPGSITAHEWLPAITTLDQGDIGSCVGNASTYHLSQLYASDLAKLQITADDPNATLGLTPDDPTSNQLFARELYHQATEADGFPGTWRPDDTGSSGLAACRVCAKQTVIASYTWATDTIGTASLLQTAGCIIGMPWYQAFFEPDSHGFIDADPNWQQSSLEGGHEVYVEALESWDVGNIGASVIRFHNSWTDSWGDKGCGRMHLTTYEALKDQIDVKQFQLTSVEPAPAPAPPTQ